MSVELHERVAAIETKLSAIDGTVQATAADVRAIRDKILVAKGMHMGMRRLGAILAGIVAAGGSLGAGFGAVFGFLHR